MDYGVRKQAHDLNCYLNVSGWPDEFGRAIFKFCSREDKDSKPIRVLSLFSGAGGLDIGFHDANFTIVESVELEEKFCRTLLANSQPGRLFEGSKVNCIDVRDYHPGFDDIDFIIGGPPCQTFSAAGRRANGVLGTSDARGVLFKEYVRLLEETTPLGFLFENVYGIVGAENGKPWKEILRSFSSIGYSLYYRVLDAADYGVPQHRERLIIIGLKEGDYRFPRPLFGPDSIDCEEFYTAKKAIESAPNLLSDIPDKINGRYAELIPGIPPGLNYSFYTEKMGHPNPIFSWRSKFSDFMYKADPDRPVRTIKAQGGQYTGPFHWDNRHFSIPEYKRLQTFPDEYEVIGTRQTVIHQLGNSVPPQLARILALSVREQVFNRKNPLAFSYLHPEDKLSFRKEKSKLSGAYKQKAALAISSLRTATDSVAHSREYSATLDDNFKYIEHDSDRSTGYLINQKCSQQEILIEVLESALAPNGASQIYRLKLRPSGGKWGIPVAGIDAVAIGTEPRVLTVAWKAIEHVLIENEFKADLVQLSGYYQYSSSIKLQLSVERGGSFASILESVTEGEVTRRMMKTKELAEAWNIDSHTVPMIARKLRSLGFEIRNKNTNAQIPRGAWLIPYEFPTLNPLSVQLKKQV